MRGYAAVVAYGRETGAWGSYLKYKFGEFKFGTGIKFGQFKALVNYHAVLPILDASFEERRDIRVRRSVAGYDNVITDSSYTEGALTAEFTYRGLELLLLCVFGHASHSPPQEDDIYNGFYKHFLEFQPDNRTRPWKFGEFKFGEGVKFGQKKARRLFFYISCEEYNLLFISNLIRSFSLSGRAGETLKAYVDTTGWKKVALFADVSSVPFYSDRARFADVSLKIGGREVTISSFELKIERNLQRRKTSKLELDEPAVSDWGVSFRFSSRERINEETYGVLAIDSGKGHRVDIYMPRMVPLPKDPSVSAGRFIYENSFYLIKPDAYPSSFPVPPSGERREVYAVVRIQENRSLWEV